MEWIRVRCRQTRELAWPGWLADWLVWPWKSNAENQFVWTRVAFREWITEGWSTFWKLKLDTGGEIRIEF